MAIGKMVFKCTRWGFSILYKRSETFIFLFAFSSNDYLMLKWLFAKVFVNNFLLANTTPLTLDSAKTPHHDIWHHTKPSALDTTSHHDTKPLTVPKPEMGKRLEAIKGMTGFFQIEVFPKIKVLKFWGIGGISQTNLTLVIWSFSCEIIICGSLGCQRSGQEVVVRLFLSIFFSKFDPRMKNCQLCDSLSSFLGLLCNQTLLLFQLTIPHCCWRGSLGMGWSQVWKLKLLFRFFLVIW